MRTSNWQNRSTSVVLFFQIPLLVTNYCSFTKQRFVGLITLLSNNFIATV